MLVAVLVVGVDVRVAVDACGFQGIYTVAVLESRFSPYVDAVAEPDVRGCC